MDTTQAHKRHFPYVEDERSTFFSSPFSHCAGVRAHATPQKHEGAMNK